MKFNMIESPIKKARQINMGEFCLEVNGHYLLMRLDECKVDTKQYVSKGKNRVYFVIVGINTETPTSPHDLIPGYIYEMGDIDDVIAVKMAEEIKIKAKI